MTKGFTVIREERISYYKGTGTFLKHDRTGFKVFYFKPDKGNSNCFSYWFNTPVKDSTGVAHALEHVVLQGSERYPVKNVFPHLRERSVAKNIGAGTGQHYTEFQAETYVAKDYFRLLEIFGDTVFFPLITQNAFNQEVWRFDLDENGRPFINGVVFNEMSSKNIISSFYQDNNVKSKLYKGSENEFISGGSFLEIPELTREALVEFHKKNYTPGNCILFLYGKIDLDEQLSFLEEKLLCRLPENTKEIPIKDELIPLPPLSQIEVCTPFKGVEECSVVLNVICRDDSVEDYRERDFILDRIGALLKKKLKYSEIGNFFEKRDGTPRHSCFEFGLDSVKKENVEKAKAVLLETLEHCLDDGMDYEELRAECNRKDLDFECPDVDFPDKEIAYKIYSGNVESGNPFKYIFEMEEEWEKLKGKVLSYDDEDFRNRLREYLLDNPNKSFCILTPDRKYYENIEIERKKKLESKLAESGLSVEEIRKSKIAFENYLEEDESNLVSELFPMLDIKDLSDFDDAGLDDVDKVSSKCGDVYLFSSKQETEGLAVISICFALDNLTQDEYKQLKWVSPFFRNLVIDGKSSI
ncbi:MAG: insulinase family protein, partial [Spirochaetales bacterium]|nr:insulinase family protein [Spirochaetales bacterium]